MKVKNRKIAGSPAKAITKKTEPKPMYKPRRSPEKNRIVNNDHTATKSDETPNIQKVTTTEESNPVVSTNIDTPRGGTDMIAQAFRLPKTVLPISTNENANGPKSSLDVRGRIDINRTSSLKPFPQLDPEFYSAEKDILWNKDLLKVQTERKMLLRPQSERRFKDEDLFIFGKSDIFHLKTAPIEEKEIDLDKNVPVQRARSKDNPGRKRDFHSSNIVIGQDMPPMTAQNQEPEEMKEPTPKKAITTIFVDFGQSKKITPMNFKLYESTMQDDIKIERQTSPRSHPTYNKKDDSYIPKCAEALKKKIESNATSYNFLKASSKKIK